MPSMDNCLLAPHPRKIASGAVRLGGHSVRLVTFTKRKNTPRRSEAQYHHIHCVYYLSVPELIASSQKYFPHIVEGVICRIL